MRLSPRTSDASRQMNEGDYLVPIGEVAAQLFGDRSATNRKRVRVLVATGELCGVQIGATPHAPFFLSRQSVEAFTAKVVSSVDNV